MKMLKSPKKMNQLIITMTLKKVKMTKIKILNNKKKNKINKKKKIRKNLQKLVKKDLKNPKN